MSTRRKDEKRRAVLCSCVACSYKEVCYVKTYKTTACCHKCKAELVINKSGDEWTAKELATQTFEQLFAT